MRLFPHVLALTLVSVLGCSSPSGVDEWSTNAVVGTEPGYQAPAFTLRDTSDSPVALSSYRGKIVVLDFWASWCAPCLDEIPNLRELHRRYADSGAVIIGVSQDISRRSWKTYLDNHTLGWLQVYDESGTNSVARRYGVVGIPSNFVLNRFGVIEATNVHGESLREEVSRLLRE